MKRLLFLVAVALMVAMGAEAQKLKVIDSDGNAVSYASVLTSTGEYVGITSLEGELADLKGAKAVTITHVAFKPKEVKVGSADQVVTLEDADFGLDEITVAPKPLVYVQTYYRMYVYSAKDGMLYYRVGITDNAYDRQKKTVKGSTNHVAKSTMGPIKFALGLMGKIFDELFGEIKVEKVEDRMMKKYSSLGLKFVDAGPGKKNIVDKMGLVGSVVDDKKDGLRRYIYDTTKLYGHNLEASGKSKKLKKTEERNTKKQNRHRTDYILYRIDEEGNYAPEDFVMRENLDSYDELVDGELDHQIFAIQAFNTKRAYVTKEEYKQLKKDNKIKLTYENIKQFERQNNIPALLPVVQEKLKEVWKVDD